MGKGKSKKNKSFEEIVLELDKKNELKRTKAELEFLKRQLPDTDKIIQLLKKQIISKRDLIYLPDFLFPNFQYIDFVSEMHRIIKVFLSELHFSKSQIHEIENLLSKFYNQLTMERVHELSTVHDVYKLGDELYSDYEKLGLTSKKEFGNLKNEIDECKNKAPLKTAIEICKSTHNYKWLIPFYQLIKIENNLKDSQIIDNIRKITGFKYVKRTAIEKALQRFKRQKGLISPK